MRVCARVGVRVFGGGALCYSQGPPPSPHWEGGQQKQGPPLQSKLWLAGGDRHQNHRYPSAKEGTDRAGDRDPSKHHRGGVGAGMKDGARREGGEQQG